MTIALPRLGVEDACARLAAFGFARAEVYLGQLTPQIVDIAPSLPAAAAAGEMVRNTGLEVGLINAITDPQFDPVGDEDAATERLAGDLRLADAMGAAGVLIWDGFVSVGDTATLRDAPSRLARCIERARSASGLATAPPVSIELHPFTWILTHNALSAAAGALTEVGAGLCLDFCHLGVSMGADFIAALTPEILAAVNHVHFSDTDCRTSELHMPPGHGVLDLDGIDEVLKGVDAAWAWDLFGWPAPASAMADRRRFDRSLDRAGQE